MINQYTKQKNNILKRTALMLILTIIICLSFGGCNSNSTVSDLSDGLSSPTTSSSEASSSDLSSDTSSEESSDTQSSSSEESSSVTSKEESKVSSTVDNSSSEAPSSSEEASSDNTSSEETPKTVIGETVPNFSFAFTTDVHVGQKESNLVTLNAFYQDLSKLISEGEKVHAVTVAGDLTQNSYKDEYNTLLSYIRNYSPAGLTTYSTMGNHDARSYDFEAGGRTMEERWNEVLPYYLSFIEDSTGISTTTPYYHVEIEGNNNKKYDLIVLCTEFGLNDDAYISNKQIVWFGQKLKAISEEKGDQNIIVMCHQPVPGTHRDESSNQFGSQGEVIKMMISQYPQVIYLSGHIHSGLSNRMVYDQGAGTYVDGLALANYSYYHYIDIYNDCIRVRVRSTGGQWLNSNETVIWTK